MSEELRDRIKSVIDTEPVSLFMKGTPTFVMCGNSERALQALRNAGAPVTTVDILPDPEIRQELATLSGWPTIPQVFIKGELVGGADIVQELAASGELERKLVDALGEDYREAAEERVVSVLVPASRKPSARIRSESTSICSSSSAAGPPSHR
jgi:monothiol glutaredoxin